MLRSSFLAPYLLAACFVSVQSSSGQSPERPAPADVRVSSTSFDRSAGSALQVMKAKAEELKIGGAAVLAYFDGDKIESWSSKMLVVGRVKDEPKGTDKGSNLLGIAYAKAAEMRVSDCGVQRREVRG